MRPPFRIAILECDTPLTQTREKYGGYGGVFTALLKAGADGLNQPDLISSKDGLDLSSYDVVTKQEYPDLDSIDAVLITGSRFDSFAHDPWITKLVSFTQSILSQRRIRLIGVCFGHQIIGRALGAPVGRSNRGWEMSVHSVTMTAKGRELFGGKDVISLHQMHRDIVYAYPHSTVNGEAKDMTELSAESSKVPKLEIEPLGHSPLCEVQGMYAKGSLISVQGHPEFTQQIVTELLEARHQQGVFDDKQFEDGMHRVGRQHDGVLVAGAFLRFLLED